MNIQYDKFVPIKDVVWPNKVPFEYEAFHSNGIIRKGYVTDFNELDDVHPDAVAIKIPKPKVPQHILERAREIAIKEYGANLSLQELPSFQSGRMDHDVAVRAAIAGLMNSSRAPARVDGLPQWVIDQTGLLPKHAREIRSWQKNVSSDNYTLGDFLERKVGNRVLGVRNYFQTGQRVILPSGHSLSMTKAKNIYAQIKTNGYLEDYSIEVGELTGKRRDMRNHRITYDKMTEIITVGCQKIPFQALADLAVRLEWSGKYYAR